MFVAFTGAIGERQTRAHMMTQCAMLCLNIVAARMDGLILAPRLSPARSLRPPLTPVHGMSQWFSPL